MLKFIATFALITSLAACCNCTTSPNITTTPPATPPQSLPIAQPLSEATIVDHLYAEICTFAEDYPELAQFPAKANPTHENLCSALRYDFNVKSYSEMRGTRQTDLGIHGIDLTFIVCDESNEPWTEGNSSTYLKNLKKFLHCNLLLSANPSPGLEAKLNTLLNQHKALLEQLNQQAEKLPTKSQ